MMQTPLAPTSPYVPREALMQQLDAVASKHLLYIHAPAGYGKTFTARLWLTRRNARTAWVSLNESSGRKPGEFCERFTTALCKLEPDNHTLKEHITHKAFEAAPFEFTDRALNLFRLHMQNDVEYIIVFDDLHLMVNKDLLRFLPHLLEALDNVTVLFLSRAEPPDCLADMLVKNMVSIIDAESLKFSTREIQLFFSSAGQNLTKRQVNDLFQATGGWAVGLNAIMLSGKLTTGRKLVSRYLETYIREQLWENWEESRRKFMLCVSIEDELTPDFCNAMSGRKDSNIVLDELVRENAFISKTNGITYRFHHLFQEFLNHMLADEPVKLRKELYRKAGDYFYDHGNYYKAVEYYIKCSCKKGITKGLRLMYNYNSPYAAIESTLAIIHQSIDNSIVDEYPFLLEVQAWTAFVEGRGDDMEAFIDSYFKKLPIIIAKHPASRQTAILLRFMDYRNSFVDVSKSLKKLPLSWFGQANTPSLSQNMPHLHRSGRDFCEYFIDTEKKMMLIRKTLGVLLGKEYPFLENLLYAGLSYEQGLLNDAHEYALLAHTQLSDDFAPELQFCFYMMQATIFYALNQPQDAEKILCEAEKMIEQNKAYYLSANYEAYLCRHKLYDGDTEAAKEWLEHRSEPLSNNLTFFKLYQHFTTARAYLAVGDYNAAIIFLKKLQALCEKYRRPLDVIEINILLSIAYWKKIRSGQNGAFSALKEAIISARKYGVRQIFADEGAELNTMLHKLHKQAIQNDYVGELTAGEIKELYYLTLAKSKYTRGLTANKVTERIKFTDKQKKIMCFLNEGLTQNEMASKLKLKPSTIKSHMILIYKKLDVSNQTEAVIKMRELHILD